MTPLIWLAADNSTLLQKLLGLSPENAGKFERLSFRNLTYAAGWTQWALILLLLFAFVWFTWLYWRDGTRPSWWLKGPMTALRLLAVVALVILLAQPTLRLHHSDDIRPNVILLVDNSESMARPDPKLPFPRAEMEAGAAGVPVSSVGNMTRLDRANAILNRARLMEILSKRYTVRLYTFASAPKSIPLPADPKKRAAYRFAIPPDDKNGDSTQMGPALRRAFEDLAGQPIAGALVLSDGGNNLGEDPVPVADTMRQSRIPVSATGVGDPTKTKDVALLSVLADDVVRANNTVTVYAALSHRGYAGKTITVTLQRGSEVIGRETVTFGPDDQKREVHFTYVPTQAGRFYYTVSAAVQPGEITAANNKRAFVQTVISKKLKVLYVEGEPRYEYRYLRNAILRDTSLEFACLLLSNDVANGSEGNIVIRGFPQTEKELFEYDMVVLGDVPRSYFSQGQMDALRRFVEDRGASLLVVAGEQHMPHEYAGTPLEAILPVVITPSPDPILSDDPFQWQLTPEGRRSPVMQLEDSSAENARTWANLPGMYWAAGVVRAKPGATVLAVHPTRRNADGPRVLVATQPFGAGKCYMELVDSTYLWRWRVGDRYFYRYWGQVLRTLTPKELPGNSRFVQLNADRNNYRLGEKVALNARLLDAYYHPIKTAGATATVKSENGQAQSVVLKATPGSPGLYTAEFPPDRVGRYEVSLTSPVNPDAKASTGFVVESLALERQKPELDEELLKKVAASGGGKYYAPNALADWAKSLPDHPLQVRTELEIELWNAPVAVVVYLVTGWNVSHLLPSFLANAPLFLLLFILPLTLEWFLRKRTGLL